MAKTFKVKRPDFGVEIRTFPGEKSHYLVIKTGNTFHVFAEVEAKQAATDCGCSLDPQRNNPSRMWNERWKAASKP
jgi:hypothetical protein